MCNETKTCSKCGMELPVTEFSLRNASKDKLQSYCRKCNTSTVADWKKEKPEEFKKHLSDHRKRYPDRDKARGTISNLVRRGKLPRAETLECVFKDDDTECHGMHQRHHWNGYENPLDVICCCKKHHDMLHTGELVYEPQEE